MTALRLVQGTPEWLEGRRHLVTGTDIPVLLGLSPYRCEADLADEKNGLARADETLRMRIGRAMEPTIIDEWERATGERAQRFRAMVGHPVIQWAAASPDARVVGRRCLLELKWTGSRSRFADGLPQDVEAQIAWQLGVTGYGEGEVVVLTPDELLRFPVRHDADLFSDLLRVAGDFRRRLAEGGPFARDAARIRRDHPADDGSQIEADADTAEAVRALLDIRAQIARHKETEDRFKAVIEARMGDAAVMTGEGFRVTWKRSKDRTDTDWRGLADELLASLPETDREAVVGRHVTVSAGFRPLRVTADKEA
jgi:putative phage-type endonuclease